MEESKLQHEQFEPVYDLKMDQLLSAGYIYKMDNLSDEERDEWLNGGKWTDPKTGKEVRVPSRDFDYFYKEVEGAEVKIFHVIGDFYYNGIRLMSADQLPAIEKSAVENKHWDDLLKTIPDSKPVEHKMPDTLKDGQCVITLQGGPLDGQKRAYISAAKAYVEVVGRKVVAGRIVSQTARYLQNPEEPTIFHFKQMI